jgi:hypothetical protein
MTRSNVHAGKLRGPSSRGRVQASIRASFTRLLEMAT